MIPYHGGPGATGLSAAIMTVNAAGCKAAVRLFAGEGKGRPPFETPAAPQGMACNRESKTE